MNKVKSIFKKFNLTDLIIFLIPVVLFSFILYVYFPGILSPDSHNQLWQIATGEFTVGHPFIHTFIELICLRIWNNPASVAILQILLFSIIWMFICKHNRNDDSKRTKVLQIILTFLVCIVPLNSTSAITLWKDTLYAYLMLLFAFLILIGVNSNFKYKNMTLIFISFIIALIPNIRHNGILSSLIGLILLVILTFIYDKKSFNYLKIIGLSVMFYLLLMVPAKIYKVESGINAGGVVETKLFQLSSYLLYTDTLNKEEKQNLSNYADIDTLRNASNPYFMDPIMALGIDHSKFNKEDFYKTMFSIINNHKKESLIFFKKSTTVLYSLDRPDDCYGTGLFTSIDSFNNYLNYKHINNDTKLYNKVNNAILASSNVKGLNAILYNPVLYFYFGIILAIFMSIWFKKKYWLIIIPNFFNVLGLTLTIPSQDIRYVYPNFFIVYLLVLIFISKGNFKRNMS